MMILLMGVAGSGKTTIGELLAEDLGWAFYDGDDFHPKENVEKMASGIPLTDEDRAPWLQRLNRLMRELNEQGKNAVLACSALKKSYRDILSHNLPDLHIIHLKGDFKLIEDRMQTRKGHYMKPGMLKSQFETLEESEGLLTLHVQEKPSAIVAHIRAALGV